MAGGLVSAAENVRTPRQVGISRRRYKTCLLLRTHERNPSSASEKLGFPPTVCHVTPVFPSAYKYLPSRPK